MPAIGTLKRSPKKSPDGRGPHRMISAISCANGSRRHRFKDDGVIPTTRAGRSFFIEARCG